MMSQMMAMPEAERAKQLEQSKSMCICTSCPSYKDTGETGCTFCDIGKSNKKRKKATNSIKPIAENIIPTIANLFLVDFNPSIPRNKPVKGNKYIIKAK